MCVMYMDEARLLPYRVGPLMYTPAIRQGVADKLAQGAYAGLGALALCLEDSIADEGLEAAEQQLFHTLREVAGKADPASLPLLFVRIRSPRHWQNVYDLLGGYNRLLTGYILPKFDLSNAPEYIALLQSFLGRFPGMMIMPTLESGMVAQTHTRADALLRLRALLEPVKEHVLNIRVGGNDFCNLFGVRRAEHQTIYDIGLVRDILVDILNVFSGEYVVSGPVWEYCGETAGGAWEQGLRRELEMDLLNGFVGKTAIHPTQVPVIREGLKVRRRDYEDALRLLSWTDAGLAVGRSADGGRMNEVKCHARWAERILCRAEVYGVMED